MAAAGPKKAEWLTCIRIVWIRYHKQLAKHSSIHLTFFVNGVLVDIFTAAVSGQAGESGGKKVLYFSRGGSHGYELQDFENLGDL